MTRHRDPRHDATPAAWAAIGVLCGSLWLSACGGGGDASAPPPPPAPTALPDLDIVAPAEADLGATVALSTSVTPAAALKPQWDFGDGTTATDTAPQHQFERAGDLTVKLTLTNEAGAQKTYSKAISLTNKALVKGNYCRGESDQGWCWVPPQTSGNVVRDVQFADASTGWRSDEFGDVFKTVDGGRSWTRQPTGVQVDLSELVVRSTQELLAVSRTSSLILISPDGGTTWQKQSLPEVGTTYLSIHALGQGRVLAMPSPAAELATSTAQYLDRPSGTWQPVGLGKVEQLSVGPDGSILTYSGGLLTRRASPLAAAQTVFTLPALATPVRNDFVELQRTNDRVVWLVRVYGDFRGTAVLYRSVDDGQNWQTISPSIAARFETTRRLMPQLKVSDASGMAVAMTTATFGPVAETLTDGLWHSDDGGQTWTQTLAGGFNTFAEMIHCLPVKLNVLCVRGRASPADTRTHVSQDYGASFRTYEGDAYDAGAALRVNTTSGFGIAPFDFSSVRPLFAGYYDLDDNPFYRPWFEAPVPSFASRKVARRVLNGSLLATTDGGRSWSEVGQLRSIDGKDTVVPGPRTGADYIRAVQMPDNRTTVLFAFGGAVMSSDGGITWTRPAELNTSGLSIKKLQFQDAKFGWALGAQGASNQLVVTRDTGKTWRAVSAIPAPTPLAVFMGGAQELTVIDANGSVYKSSDEGSAWTNQGNVNGPLNSVFFSQGGATYWATANAGALFKSTDKGATWQKVQLASTVNLLAACFSDDNNGWVSGQAGQMWTTRDAGTTWRQQLVPAKEDLTSLACQDSRTVWVGGRDGLLATGTGGD